MSYTKGPWIAEDRGQESMKIKWVNNKYGGQKDGYIDGKRLYILQQNSYGRKLWQAESVSNGRILDKSGYDCFTLAIAKKLCEENRG